MVYLNVCSRFLVQPPVPLINTFWAGFKVPVIVVFFKWINLSLIIIIRSRHGRVVRSLVTNQ